MLKKVSLLKKLQKKVAKKYYPTIYPNSRSLSSRAWVQRMKAGLWPNPHVGWPSGLWPLAKPYPTVFSPACRWRLRLARRESLFLLSRPASLMVGPNYKAPSCPTATVWEFVQYEERKNGGNFLLVGLLPTTSAPPPPP